MKRILKAGISISLLLTLLLSLSFNALALSGVTDNKANATTREEILNPSDNDYRSRTETVYHGINGEDVTLYGFYRDYLEIGNNPNFSQILMLYQCIKYKDKYPERDVYITVQSFHFSVVLSACVDPEKPDYGHMKNLYNEEYNSDGYYRLSYLLVEAARKGIEVTVVGQLDASATEQEVGVLADYSFADYFYAHLSDDAYIEGKKVGDFMDFRFCKWLSYEDKSATDMMHNKICTVSNFIDNDGVEHGAAIWCGSINIDGVNLIERNGHESIQTSVVITGHEKLREVMYNYARLLINYCEQEDVVPFRAEASARATEQIKLLSEGRGDEIPEGEQIVYIGTESDKVFELYFTPLGGNFSTWDTENNPYIKYIAKLLENAKGDDYIEFVWNNVKYNQGFELADMMMEAVAYAFKINSNKSSLLHLQLPGLNTSYFDELVVGENIGIKRVNETNFIYHIKDLQLSYVENGERVFVTILNSLNMHEGSMYHQTNTILVIKETESMGSNFYTKYATLTTTGIDFLSRGTKEN